MIWVHRSRVFCSIGGADGTKRVKLARYYVSLQQLLLLLLLLLRRGNGRCPSDCIYTCAHRCRYGGGRRCSLYQRTNLKERLIAHMRKTLPCTFFFFFLVVVVGGGGGGGSHFLCRIGDTINTCVSHGCPRRSRGRPVATSAAAGVHRIRVC